MRRPKQVTIDSIAPCSWTVRVRDESGAVREMALSGNGPWDLGAVVQTDVPEKESDIQRLARSFHGALVSGGMDEQLADSLLDVAESVMALFSGATDSQQAPLDAEIDRLVTSIEGEMKRSALNLGTLVRTACRDEAPDVLRSRVAEVVKMHIRCEAVMIEMLMGLKRLEPNTAREQSPSN